MLLLAFEDLVFFLNNYFDQNPKLQYAYFAVFYRWVPPFSDRDGGRQLKAEDGGVRGTGFFLRVSGWSLVAFPPIRMRCLRRRRWGLSLVTMASPPCRRLASPNNLLDEEEGGRDGTRPFCSGVGVRGWVESFRNTDRRSLQTTHWRPIPAPQPGPASHLTSPSFGWGMSIVSLYWQSRAEPSPPTNSPRTFPPG